MDATLKRRMWKVAKVHLALTLFAIFTPVAFYIISRSSFFPDRFANYQLNVIYALQPHFGVLVVLNPDAPLWMFLSCVGAIPLWSMCFGWIVIQLLRQLNQSRNWLNHFPTLGRKAF